MEKIRKKHNSIKNQLLDYAREHCVKPPLLDMDRPTELERDRCRCGGQKVFRLSLSTV